MTDNHKTNADDILRAGRMAASGGMYGRVPDELSGHTPVLGHPEGDGPAPILTPWSETHMSEMNERFCAISSRLGRSIDADDFQQVDILSRALLHLAMTINSFYGR